MEKELAVVRKPNIYDAFFEAPIRVQAAFGCFLAGKFMFIMSAFAMLTSSKVLAIITMSTYAAFILASIGLAAVEMWERGKNDDRTF